MNNIIAGVDIGGSHITVALVDLGRLEILPESFIRERFDSSLSAGDIIQNWATVIRKAYVGFPDLKMRIGIAIPGPFDYIKGISFICNQGKYDALYNLNVKTLLSEELDISENQIRLGNDAGCFLQGEILKGEMNGYESAVGLTLGTGLGSAYIDGKKAYDADLWKMQYLDGIIEDYISTRWFIKEFYKRTNQNINDVKELVENYSKHEITLDLFNEFSKNLASFLHTFITKRRAQMVVLGGNISKSHELFLNPLKKHLNEALGYSIPINLSVLGESAALMGAASLFKEQH